jgi:hypothetical protein
MNPFDTEIKHKNGDSSLKVHVMYIDGDFKICDGCDKRKERIAAIRMICGDVACICQDCIMDLSRAWDEPRTLLTEFTDIYEK